MRYVHRIKCWHISIPWKCQFVTSEYMYMYAQTVSLIIFWSAMEVKSFIVLSLVFISCFHHRNYVVGTNLQMDSEGMYMAIDVPCRNFFFLSGKKDPTEKGRIPIKA